MRENEWKYARTVCHCDTNQSIMGSVTHAVVSHQTKRRRNNRQRKTNKNEEMISGQNCERD